MSRRDGRDDGARHDRREADRQWSKKTEKVIDARLDGHVTRKEAVDRLADLARVYKESGR